MIARTSNLIKIATTRVKTVFPSHVKLSLDSKIALNFSVQNYMKTYEANQITRYHGRIRVDENAHIYSDPAKL